MQVDLSDNDEIGIDFDNFNIEEELKLFEDCTIKPTDILIRLYIQPIVQEMVTLYNRHK